MTVAPRTNSEGVIMLKALSRVLGWTYVACWSISFYPQPYINWKRRSTQGLAIDFPTANLLGFTVYTVSITAFLWSSTVRDQYAQRHPLSPEPTVKFNDWVFAAHALILCVVGYSQFWPQLWGFNTSLRQKVSRVISSIAIGSAISILITIGLVWFKVGSWELIDLIYELGYIKILCSLIKYTPQVYLNYKRKSTVGFNIDQILLDFSGGVLSLLQLVVDCSLQSDWSGFLGNPMKLGLANTSLFFDTLFFIQHYYLYRSTEHYLAP